MTECDSACGRNIDVENLRTDLTPCPKESRVVGDRSRDEQARSASVTATSPSRYVGGMPKRLGPSRYPSRGTRSEITASMAPLTHSGEQNQNSRHHPSLPHGPECHLRTWYMSRR